MSYAPIWDSLLPENADPLVSFGSRKRSEERLNFSLDESLIELTHMISASGQREIHLGWQKVLDRPVEIHRLQESDPQRRMRFWAESHALAQIEHPGVMPIHDRGDDFMSLRPSPPKLFMDLIGPNGAVGDQVIRALECVAKVLDTLRHSHEQGVIHGDIQPAHIAIGKHGEVLLQNWQLSASVDEEVLPAGTPAWLAPEASQGAYRGDLADIFQVAALIHFVFTGTPPWRGKTAQECLAAMNGGVQASFEDDFTATSLGKTVLSCLAVDPTQRPPLHQLASALQNWLADAGQKAEAQRLLHAASQRVSNLPSIRSDKELRHAQREVMTARALDEHIDKHFLERICQQRFQLAIEREDVILAQALLSEHLKQIPGDYEEQLAQAIDRRERRKRWSALLRKVLIGAGALAALIPLALMAITYFSDRYQDIQSRRLADELIFNARSAHSWSQAQALLAHGSGLAPDADALEDVQAQWAEKGISDALSRGDVVNAEQRLELASQAFDLAESPRSQILIQHLSTQIKRERERQQRRHQQQWLKRQQLMTDTLQSLTEHILPNEVREIAEQWGAWNWHEADHFDHFTQFLYELVAQGGVRSYVASQTLLFLDDRQRGNDPSLAGFDPVNLMPLMGLLYDDNHWVRETMANEIAQRADPVGLDYFLSVLLHLDNLFLINVKSDLVHRSNFKPLIDHIYETVRGVDVENTRISRNFIHYLYREMGFSSDATMIASQDWDHRARLRDRLIQALWDQRHEQVDNLATELLEKEDDPSVRANWIISRLHRLQYREALSILEASPDTDLTFILQALKVSVLFWNEREDEARSLAVELLKNRRSSHMVRGAALGYFTDALDQLGLSEEKELFTRQVVASDDANWWTHLELIESLRQAGKLEDALYKSQHTLARWPQFHFGHAEQARIFLDMGRHDEAAEAAEMALSIMPRNPSILSGHAQVLLHQGEVEHALARYTMATKMKSSYLYGYFQMLLYGRSTDFKGTTFDGLRGWYHGTKTYFYKSRIYTRIHLEHGLTHALQAVLQDPALEPEQLRYLINDILLHVGNLAATGWPSINAQELARACFNEAVVQATDDNGSKASTLKWLQLALKHDASYGQNELFRVLRAWAQPDQSTWSALLAEHTEATPGSSINEGWVSIADSALRQRVLLQLWSKFDAPPDHTLPWPMVQPDHHMSMWQRERHVPELWFDPSLQAAILTVWKQHAVDWIAFEQPSVDLQTFTTLGADDLSPQQRLLVTSWFDHLEWPQGQKVKAKKLIKSLPRVDASWDFPPQVWRARKERLKEFNTK